MSKKKKSNSFFKNGIGSPFNPFLTEDDIENLLMPEENKDFNLFLQKEFETPRIGGKEEDLSLEGTRKDKHYFF
jgi:hypothetical protein